MSQILNFFFHPLQFNFNRFIFILDFIRLRTFNPTNILVCKLFLLYYFISRPILLSQLTNCLYSTPSYATLSGTDFSQSCFIDLKEKEKKVHCDEKKTQRIINGLDSLWRGISGIISGRKLSRERIQIYLADFKCT